MLKALKSWVAAIFRSRLASRQESDKMALTLPDLRVELFTDGAAKSEIL